LDTAGKTEVLVVLDDTDAKALARQMREALGVRNDNSQIRAEKVRLYRQKKRDALLSLNPQDGAVLKDYDNFPILHMRINARAMAQLLSTTDVSYIAEDRQVIPYLAQSLPLTGVPQAQALGATGSSTSVAVLDTGVNYALSAFGSCSAPGVPSTCKVPVSQCFAAGGCLGNTSHGTNVSGIVVGVAPDTKILDLRVFRTDGFAYYSDILNALNWVMANRQAYNIVSVNMSLGGGRFTAPCPSDGLAAAIANLKTAGIATAAAAGNDAYTDAIGAPACIPDAISVGAVYDSNVGGVSYSACSDVTTAADKVTCFSDSASFLTLLAPGAPITAAGITMYGTSQATPHVAGSVSLLKDANSSLTVNELVAALVNTGTPVTDTRNNITKPRIDLYDAVSEALCLIYQVRLDLSPPAYYTTIQDAYAAAPSGAVIQVQAIDFIGDFVFNRTVPVTLRGGYNCEYSVNAATTTLEGSLTVGGGGLAVEKLTVQFGQ
jgi:subtilisin family serine protease